MDKVYAVYTGCIYEGGGVGSLHRTRDGAIKSAMFILNEKQQEHEELWGGRKDKVYADHYEKHMWKQVDENSWSNSIDEIVIHEYDLND